LVGYEVILNTLVCRRSCCNDIAMTVVTGKEGA
jgi:hypothetical protein